jgi:hypothetical protein
LHLDDLLDIVTDAVATDAGFYEEGCFSAARLLNNPGLMSSWRLPDGEFYPVAYGYSRKDEGLPAHRSKVILTRVVRFPDEDTGWRSLRAQCRMNVLKRSFSTSKLAGYVHFVNVAPRQFEPMAEFVHESGAPATLSEALAARLGVTPDRPLVSLIDPPKFRKDTWRNNRRRAS